MCPRGPARPLVLCIDAAKFLAAPWLQTAAGCEKGMIPTMNPDQILEFITKNFPSVLPFVLIISLLIGLALCLFGYRLFKLWVAILGFFFGFGLGDQLAASLHANTTVSFLLTIGLGVVFCILVSKFYKAGVFLFAAVAAFALCWALSGGNLVLAAIVAILAGIAGVFFTKMSIMISTSFSGAQTAATALISLLSLQAPYLAPILICVFTIVGVFFQWKRD